MKKKQQVRYWLEQRAFYQDLSQEDISDINDFLLTDDIVNGLSPFFYNDPVIANIASVAESYHAGQTRKASPTHPYMKHVYMTTFQIARTLPGGDLEQSMQTYLNSYQTSNMSPYLLAGATLLHDALESNKAVPRFQLYNDLLLVNTPADLSETITAVSRYMTPADKPPHLPSGQYLSFKDDDVLRYFEDSVIEKLGLHPALAARLAKVADVLSNGLETLDDMIKGKEGTNLEDAEVFNANLKTRIEMFQRRLAIFMEKDPLNPFIPQLKEVCAQLLNHATSINGIEH